MVETTMMGRRGGTRGGLVVGSGDGSSEREIWVAGVDGACGWWPVGGSRSYLVGVVGGDPWVAFGGRRRRILSCVRGWASPMVVRGAVRCRD
jgi:hypothetical protein